MPELAQRDAEVERRRRLGDPALLVGERDDLGHHPLPGKDRSVVVAGGIGARLGSGVGCRDGAQEGTGVWLRAGLAARLGFRLEARVVLVGGVSRPRLRPRQDA